MNEEMNIPETMQFLLQQQAQFDANTQVMQEQLRAHQVQFAREIEELTQTVNAIAAAHIRAEEAHLEAHRQFEERQRRLDESFQRITEAQAVLELRAAETEAKLNALIAREIGVDDGSFLPLKDWIDWKNAQPAGVNL